MRLRNAIRDLHPIHRMTPARLPFDLSEAQVNGLKNLYLDTDLGQLDCLSEITGVRTYERVVENSVEVALGEHPCRILTLDALITAKSQMNRPRDAEAVLQLKAIRERLNGQT